MTDPFAPPKANLEVPIERGPVAANIKLAAWLTWISAALSLVWITAEWFGLTPIAIPAETAAITVGGTFVALAIFAFLGWRIYQGRNWARWVFTVWIGSGLLFQVASLATAPNDWKMAGVISWASSLLQAGLNVATIVLLFTRQARRWYRGEIPERP